MHSAYRSGFLWYPGAMNEQPAWYVAAMQMMESKYNKAESDRIKEEQSKNAN
jgi:hypothetical protein